MSFGKTPFQCRAMRCLIAICLLCASPAFAGESANDDSDPPPPDGEWDPHWPIIISEDIPHWPIIQTLPDESEASNWDPSTVPLHLGVSWASILNAEEEEDKRYDIVLPPPATIRSLDRILNEESSSVGDVGPVPIVSSSGIPTPGTLTVLALAGLFGRRRRRSY